MCRFGPEQDALLRRVVCAKYVVEERALVLYMIHDQFQKASVYRYDIMQVLGEDYIVPRTFRDSCFFCLETGTRISF